MFLCDLYLNIAQCLYRIIFVLGVSLQGGSSATRGGAYYGPIYSCKKRCTVG